ncbi:MAG: response regulator [Rhizobiales bacterium]|nr:response regulator [Hyphomicrobiales bacterium]
MARISAGKSATGRGKKRVNKRAARPRKRGASETEAALAALAHEIRTPLTGILALAELLVASDMPARERGWARAIKGAAEHLAQLTTLVCDAVRADAVGLALRDDIFDPRLLAQGIGASLEARARTGGLSSQVTIASDLPANVRGDPVRIRAALENLIDNAVKFTARGGITLQVAAAPASGGRVRLSFTVADTGIGLSAKEIATLFRPFSQASAAIARRYGGTGLGLAFVKRIAKAMGGDLTLTSKPGHGSTFRLSILAVRADARANGRKKASSLAARAAKPARSLAILCVEDNPYSRVVLNTILTELRHRVDFVGTGDAAIKAVAGGGYDLVFMDIALPDLDGIEVTRRIRALPAPFGRIPIVGVSARSGEDEAARKAGMNAFLMKPVSPALLRDTIEAVADLRVDG